MKFIKATVAVLAATVLSISMFAQGGNPRVLAGRVVDVWDEPLAGANVYVRGDAGYGTSTDGNGYFSLELPEKGDVLIEISFLGMQSEIISYTGQKEVTVILEEDANMMEGAVVTGKQNINDLDIRSKSGVITTVDVKRLQDKPMVDMSVALQGTAPGLVVTNKGDLGTKPEIRIRGNSSFREGDVANEPLFVLDGQVISSDAFMTLNPLDIADIKILKDAVACALYGTKAANGVIEITSVRGTTGEALVTYNFNAGITTRGRRGVLMMDTDEKLELELLRNDFYQRHNLSVRGGNSKTSYYASANYSYQGGQIPGNDVRRFTGRISLDQAVGRIGYVSISVNGGYSKANSPNGSTYSPTSLIYDLNPYESKTSGELWSYPNRTYDDLFYQFEKVSTEKRFGTTASINLTPVKGLTLRAQQNLEAFDYNMEYKINPDYEPFLGAGQAQASFQRYYQFTFTNTAEYVFDIAGRNNFAILVGQESIFDHSYQFGASVSGITDWRTNLLSQGTTPGLPSNSLWDTSYNSYFARLSYNLDEKYYLDASWRLDGSSLFGAGNQYANFYSVGAMWDIKKEDWMQGASWLNDLRLRVSYGTTGNSSIGTYLAIGTIGSAGLYNGANAWGIGNPSNSGLTWETVESLNVALSARMWDRVNLNVEFYNKVTHDLLMDIPFSMTTGHTSGAGNAGDMLNRGVDVDLSVDIIRTPDIYFGVTANFNYNYNEIIELFGGRDEYTVPNTGVSYQVGYPYGEYFYTRSAGVDPRDGMQMWYDLNGNKTKVYSADYAVMTGRQQFAPYSGGIQLNFQYKGLYIGADFAWMAGKWMWNNDRYFLENPLFVTDNNNGDIALLDIWLKPGDITDIPSIDSERQFDDTLLEDASFFRLKNLQISYEFPTRLIQRSGFIQGFRIYAIGRNIFTLTKYSGYDPEVDANLQMGVYPNSRQFTIGAEFTF